MALMIRLRQQGRSNAQTYRLVVTDKKNPRDGKYIENLGWYNPLKGEEMVKAERVEHWLGLGAELSESAKEMVHRSAPEVISNLNKKKEEKRLRLKAKNKK